MDLSIKKLSTKTIALLTALIVVVTMSFGAPAAQALNAGGVEGPGSITVHKYQSFTASKTPGTGTEADEEDLPSTAQPLPGAGFTLYTLDTAKVEGGASGVEAATGAPDAAGVAAFNTKYGTGATPKVVTTDANGEATFNGLALGYYLLVETTTPEDVDTSVPTIITIPYNNGDSFVKDVHIYPKNVSSKSVNKTIDGDPTEVVSPGSTITYNIIFDIPMDDDTHDYVYASETEFMTGTITDTFPTNAAGASMLDFDSFTATGLASNGDELPLNAGDITATESTGKVVFTYGKEVASAINTFNKAAANEGNPIEKIQLQVVTKVNDAAYAGGVGLDGTEGGNADFSNHVVVSTKKADGTDGPGGEDDSDDSTTIGFSALKVHGTDATEKLAGATFKLATTYANATAGTFVKTATADLTSTSNAEGILSFGGLTGDGLSNNTEIVTALTNASKDENLGKAQTVDLWLVETAAPTDYRILQAPQKITLSIVKDKDTGKVTCSLGDEAVSIGNYKNGEEGGGNFMLPNTGGTGALVFIVVGALLVVVAGVYFVRSRKRNETPRSQQ